MKHEYEAKFLSIDAAGLQAKLTALGATRAFPRRLRTRRIFENGTLEQGAWIRLRDEGERSTLTLKQVTDPTSIDGTTEIETEVSDLQAMLKSSRDLAWPRSVIRRTIARSGAGARSSLTSTRGLTSRLTSKSKGRTRSQSAGPPLLSGSTTLRRDSAASTRFTRASSDARSSLSPLFCSRPQRAGNLVHRQAPEA